MAEDHFGEHREMDFCVACRDGCPVASLLADQLSRGGYDVTMNAPFDLWRDVVRVDPGDPAERFNAAAVVLETNDRHRNRPGIPQLLATAIREVVSRHGDTHRGRL
jgi:hypothetical protein